MAQEIINLGTPNGQDGDFHRNAWLKAQSNFNELYALQFFTDRIIAGRAAWREGLIFDVSVDLYVFDGQVLPPSDPTTGEISPIVAEITLPAADPSNPRFDIITIDNEGVISFTEGTPAVNPQIPSPDFDSQLVITEVLIPAGATEPAGVSKITIFNENLGEPTEWTATETTGGTRIDLQSTEDPSLGTNNIDVFFGVRNDRIDFINDIPVNVEDMSALSLKIKKKFTQNRFSVRVRAFNGARRVSGNINISNNRFGFIDSSSDYQTILISKADLNLTSDEITRISIDLRNNNSQCFIDDVSIVFGTQNPAGTLDQNNIPKVISRVVSNLEPATLVTEINDGDSFFIADDEVLFVEFIDNSGDSPITEVYVLEGFGKGTYGTGGQNQISQKNLRKISRQVTQEVPEVTGIDLGGQPQQLIVSGFLNVSGSITTEFVGTYDLMPNKGRINQSGADYIFEEDAQWNGFYRETTPGNWQVAIRVGFSGNTWIMGNYDTDPTTWATSDLVGTSADKGVLATASQTLSDGSFIPSALDSNVSYTEGGSGGEAIFKQKVDDVLEFKSIDVSGESTITSNGSRILIDVPQQTTAWEDIIGNQKSVTLEGFSDNTVVNLDANYFPVVNDAEWNDIAFGNNTYVAVTGSPITENFSALDYVMTSSDGESWTPRTLPSQVLPRSVAFGNGVFVLVGTDRFDTVTRVMTSTDGITWIERADTLGKDLEGITFGNGLFVAVSDENSGVTGERVVTSSDGITWTVRTAPVQPWTGIIYGDNLYVAYSFFPSSTPNVNGIMTSPDGINWTQRTLPSAVRISDMAYGNGTYVATLDSDVILISEDNGVNWQEITLPVANITTVTFGNGVFLAFAGDYQTFNTILTSNDGINWTNSFDAGGGLSMRRGVFAQDKFVIVGSEDSLGGGNNSSLDVNNLEFKVFENIVNQYRVNGIPVTPSNKILDIPIGPSGINAVVEDTSPQLGENLDVQGFSLFTNENVFGFTVDADNNSAGQFRFSSGPLQVASIGRGGNEGIIYVGNSLTNRGRFVAYGDDFFSGGTLLLHNSELRNNTIGAWNIVADDGLRIQSDLSTNRLFLKNTGQLQLDNYTLDAFTGTASNYLAVDASGNVITEPIPSGGGSSFTYITESGSPGTNNLVNTFGNIAGGRAGLLIEDYGVGSTSNIINAISTNILFQTDDFVNSITISAPNTFAGINGTGGITIDSPNSIWMGDNSGMGGFPVNLHIDSDNGEIVIDANLTTQIVKINNLPTSDPGVSGALWNDGGFLAISP